MKDDVVIEIGIKRVWRDYKLAEIYRVEMMTRSQFDEFFITQHDPKTPMGEAIENHIEAFYSKSNYTTP